MLNETVASIALLSNISNFLYDCERKFVRLTVKFIGVRVQCTSTLYNIHIVHMYIYIYIVQCTYSVRIVQFRNTNLWIRFYFRIPARWQRMLIAYAKNDFDLFWKVHTIVSGMFLFMKEFRCELFSDYIKNWRM